MITLFSAMTSIVSLIGAGYLLDTHTTASVLIIGAATVALSVIVTMLQQAVFTGEMVTVVELPFTWGHLWTAVCKHDVKRSAIAGPEPLYVQTSTGLQPVISMFFARINQEPSIVLDITEDA